MSILVKIQSEFDLDSHKVEVIKAEIKEKLKGRVLNAYIFGSIATGKFHKDSDFDLLLVTRDLGIKFVERNQEFSDLLDIFPRMDILVYTEEEFKRNVEQQENSFWKDKSNLLRLI